MRNDKYYSPKTNRPSILKYRNKDCKFNFDDLLKKDVIITKKEDVLEYRGNSSFFDFEKKQIFEIDDLEKVKAVIRGDEKIAERIFSKSTKVK